MAVNDNAPHQYIPEQRQGVQDEMGELRRPPEVVEPERIMNNSPGHPEGYHNQEPILNQQWGRAVTFTTPDETNRSP